MVPLSLIIQEHLFGPGHSPIVHSVQQVKCFTLHGKHLEDKKKKFYFFFFFCSLLDIYSSIINCFLC